jgi:hypothetical protein
MTDSLPAGRLLTPGDFDAWKREHFAGKSSQLRARAQQAEELSSRYAKQAKTLSRLADWALEVELEGSLEK